VTDEEQLISGKNLVQIMDFIKHKWGSDGWERFARNQRFDPDLIYEERMYPFEDYIELLEKVQKEFHEEDIPFKVGWFRARHLLLVKGKKMDGMQLLTRVALAWRKFNSFGNIKVIQGDDRSLTITMSDLRSHPLYCQRMKGFFGALTSDGKMDRCDITEEKCVCRGDDICQFVARSR